MAQNSRKNAERYASRKRKAPRRKNQPPKLPPRSKMNLRGPKQTIFPGSRKSTGAASVLSKRSATSVRVRSNKHYVQPLQLAITAMDIPPELRRLVIIDGENVAYNELTNSFDMARLYSAIGWFVGIGHTVLLLYPDHMDQITSEFAYSNCSTMAIANCGRGPSENDVLERALLQKASEEQAAVVSERLFQSTYDNFLTIVCTRVIGYTYFKSSIFIPVDPYGRAGPWLRRILRKD